jgi:hypothetical protein
MLSTLYLQCTLCLLSVRQFCLPLRLLCMLSPCCLLQLIQQIPQKADDAHTECSSSSHDYEQHDTCLLQDHESPPVSQITG